METTVRPQNRPGVAKTHRNGVPILPAGPFAAWLTEMQVTRGLMLSYLPSNMERAANRVLSGENIGISEHIVELFGIRVLQYPRLAADLYPHLAEPVCAICRTHTCRHITG